MWKLSDWAVCAVGGPIALIGAMVSFVLYQPQTCDIGTLSSFLEWRIEGTRIVLEQPTTGTQPVNFDVSCTNLLGMDMPGGVGKVGEYRARTYGAVPGALISLVGVPVAMRLKAMRQTVPRS